MRVRALVGEKVLFREAANYRDLSRNRAFHSAATCAGIVFNLPILITAMLQSLSSFFSSPLRPAIAFQMLRIRVKRLYSHTNYPMNFYSTLSALCSYLVCRRFVISQPSILISITFYRLLCLLFILLFILIFYFSLRPIIITIFHVHVQIM
jgi:hypothetical protein